MSSSSHLLHFVVIILIYLTALSVTQIYMDSNDRMTLSNEVESMREEVVVV
jgi:hypothetical protein